MAENMKARQQSYKNCSKSSQEMRIRRHDVTVELRKSKKDDQLFKRRNIDEEDITSPLKDSNGQSPVTMTLDEIVKGMNSSNVAKRFEGIQAARKMLSRDRNPPIDVMISYGIVPICVNFLDDFENPTLQFEAAWALTNVASGTSAQTLAVVHANAVPKFVNLLSSCSTIVAEQAVWALGNIAGDGPLTRDIILNNNTIEYLLHLINSDTSISFLRNIVWLMSNLCRNKNPPPPFEKIKLMLPILSELLLHQDSAILTDASWALSYVTDDDNIKIQAVVDAGCASHLVALLASNENSIVVPVLRTVGNIVTGDDAQTDAIICAGGLHRLSKLLSNSKNNIVKEAAWTISNITAGNAAQIQCVIDAGIFPHVCTVLEKGDFRSQKEAAWIVTNTTASGTQEQIFGLIEKTNILKPFCDLLSATDAKTVKIVLSGLLNLFQLADKMGNIENLCIAVEVCGALDKLENLQTHENEDVFNKAFQLIDTYFNDENAENQSLAPMATEGALEFTTNSAPQGGFRF